MTIARIRTIHNLTRESVLRVLCYFDIFFYPLNKQEIHQFLDQPVSFATLTEELVHLCNEGRIYHHHGFYSIQNNPLLVHRRKQGGIRAERLLKKAETIGRTLYQFPFVRGIAVSGSLSKNYADQHSDIDFFIITKKNRLWIARTLMQFYTKFNMLLGKGHLCCMNYYIDEDAMRLEEENVFTAIELKTVLPIAGNETIDRFLDTNNWADEWLPNSVHKQQAMTTPKSSLVKRFGEWLFSGTLSNRLDDLLFHHTTKRWKRKEQKGKRNNKGAVLNLMTGKHFARTDPGGMQGRILREFEQKLIN